MLERFLGDTLFYQILSRSLVAVEGLRAKNVNIYEVFLLLSGTNHGIVSPRPPPPTLAGGIGVFEIGQAGGVEEISKKNFRVGGRAY